MTPTSKYDLKLQCMATARGDIDLAERMYEFLAKDINLPDIAVPPPSRFEQARQFAGSAIEWLRTNKGEIANVYNFIQSVRRGEPIVTMASAAAEVPPVE